MIACRCKVLNTLAGTAATDYVRQHLDVVREDAAGRLTLRCEGTGTSWVLEAARGPYGGDNQQRLRRVAG